MLVDALRQTYALSELFVPWAFPAVPTFITGHDYKLLRSMPACVDVITEIFKGNHSLLRLSPDTSGPGQTKISLSGKVVRRLMRQEGLAVSTARRRRYGSYLGEISPAPENLINRDFRAAAPNEKWLTDITEFQISAGKVYLSPIIDCFDGLVISWSIGMRPDAEFVNTMLDAAIETMANRDGRPVIHSDRGAHYRWPGWLTRISDAGLVRSMSRKGCSPITQPAKASSGD